MPSFSRAMSTIGRFLAACEISISDFGDWCCEAGILDPLNVSGKCRRLGTRQGSRKPRFGCEVDGLRPFAGFDLFVVGGLNAENLEAPVGANHGEAIGFDRDDFAELAADAFRIFRRQWLSVEDFQLLTVERCP